MSGFATGFITGFANDQADKITKRKDTAEEYFQQQMELAHKKAMSYNDQNGKKLDAAVSVANQMIAIGVPKNTVMAIANQNPDDLETFYQTVQELQAKGVPLNNPEVFEGLIQIDGEFNPGNENVTQLLKRVMDPLAANAKADPEGWDFDPKGSLWATMLGYNAMDRSRNRLRNTEVLPGVSAAEVLATSEDAPYNHPLGSGTVTLDAARMGDLSRDAARRIRTENGEDGISVAERRAILDTFQDFVDLEIESDTLAGFEGPEKEAQARIRAASRVMRDFPEAAGMSEITQYLIPEEGGSPAVTEEGQGSVPTPSDLPVAGAPGGFTGEGPPSAAATAPGPATHVGATPAPVAPTALPQQLPSGATRVKDNGDGTSDWKRSDGTIKTYDNNDILKLMGVTTPVMQAKPTPGYLDRLGSEYD